MHVVAEYVDADDAEVADGAVGDVVAMPVTV